MFGLVLPVLLEQLLHILVFYVDMWLAGKFLEGEDPLAAINLASYVMWFTYSVFAVVAVGATAVVARMVGSGNQREANKAMNQSLLIGIVLVLLALIGGILFLDELIPMLRLRGQAESLANRYLRVILPSLPAIMLIEVGIASLRGAGDMVTGLVVMAVVNFLNVVVSTWLLIGGCGMPALGWEGLAYGTMIAQMVGGVLLLMMMVRGRSNLQLKMNLMQPDPRMIRGLLRIGIPGGIDSLAIVGCHLWFLSIINTLGTTAAAAHGVGVRIEALAFMPGIAFSVVAATLAGQYLGSEDDRRASQSVLWTCVIGGGLMSGTGIIFYFASVPLAEFFDGGQHTKVTQIAASLVRIVAFSMPALAIIMILTGGLRGAGDTRWPLLFTFIGFLGVRIPLTYFLALDVVRIPSTDLILTGYSYGVLGAWYAMVADLVVRCLLVSSRFFHGGWKRIGIG